MSAQRAVFFDIETGGLEPTKHPIIQLAAVAVDMEHDLAERGEVEIKVRFDPATCDSGALEVNGYDAEVWSRSAVEERVAIDQFASFLRKHATLDRMSKSGKPYRLARLVGHNAAAFDGPFVKEWFRRHGVFFPADFRVLDSMQLGAWKKLGLGLPVDGLGLSDLARWLGVERVGEAHDALSDVRLTVAVTKKLFHPLGKELP